MREIKFRGKRIANGEWVYSENYKKDKYLTIAGIELTFVGDYEVDPETVGQFTGLKDKNGTEIYEGDIIAEDYFSNVNPNDLSDDTYIDDEPKKLIICYDSNQGKYKAVPMLMYKINAGNGGWTGYDVRGYKSEVIGNIHE